MESSIRIKSDYLKGFGALGFSGLCLKIETLKVAPSDLDPHRSGGHELQLQYSR